MMIRPSTKEAYRFFHDGTKALAVVEHNGIRVNVEYLDKAMIDTERQIKEYEEKLKDTKVYDLWRKRFKNPNLESTTQLGEILFNQLGHKVTHLTATGKAKTDERALETVKIPFVKDFLACKKLRKVLGTYLKGIKRETVDGVIHPSYNLAGGLEDDQKGGAGSYRGSSSNPNFQNMPIRNKMMGKIIRECFIARDGFILGEIDFSTIEVRIAASVTKDRRLIDYIVNNKDMHGDRAMELFYLTKDQVGKKTTRDAAKNKFVFPQFYGSYYVDCAKNIWEMMERGEWKIENSEVKVIDHLKKKGINRLGDCDPSKPPKKGTFEYRVKEVEDIMWNDVYHEYTAWKKVWYKKYLKSGEVLMPTGFIARGIYRRNQVLNLPIQGPAFHCLLWSIIHINAELKRRGMKSMIVGQIHDCIVCDIHKSEVQEFLTLAKQVMTVDLPKAWKWIIVPLEIEVDLVPDGMTWNDKALCQQVGGVWQMKA